jgi:hypothetical protein
MVFSMKCNENNVVLFQDLNLKRFYQHVLLHFRELEPHVRNPFILIQTLCEEATWTERSCDYMEMITTQL